MHLCTNDIIIPKCILRGFFLPFFQGAPPTDIPLLPGQIQIANDILQLEAKRCARRMSAPAVSYPDEPPSTPPPDPPRQRRASDSNRHSHPSEKDQVSTVS